ncbi:MAG: FecR domain-containing protein [Bacteroidota bacterium]
MEDEIKKDSLLLSYLLGETDEAQCMEVEAWINATAENKKYFEDLSWVWQQAALPAGVPSNKAEVWQQVRSKIMQSHKTVRMRFFWSAAAVIFTVVCVTGIIMKLSRHQQRAEMVEADLPGTSFLPDGSVVTLNNNSTIFYPAVFRENERKVRLRGEGFFNIKHIKGRPFVIEVGDVQVKVLGTSFFIRSAARQTDITVKTGQVLVFHKRDSVLLDEGETVSVHPDDTLLLAKLVLEAKSKQLTELLRRSGKLALIEERMKTTDDRKILKDSLDKTLTSKIKLFPNTSQFRNLLNAVKKAGGDSIMINGLTLDSIVRKMMMNGEIEYQSAVDTSKLETRQQKDIVKNIIRDLVAKGVVSGFNEIVMFSLTDSELIVNNSIQKTALFEKLKLKYIPRHDYGIYYGNAEIKTTEGFHLTHTNL